MTSCLLTGKLRSKVTLPACWSQVCFHYTRTTPATASLGTQGGSPAPGAIKGEGAQKHQASPGSANLESPTVCLTGERDTTEGA